MKRVNYLGVSVLLILSLAVGTPTAAQPFGCDANTMALYHFDEAGGNQVGDACHSGVTGTTTGTSTTSGVFNSARTFNGIGDHITIQNLGQTGSNRMTIEAWIFPKGFPLTGGETKYVYKRRQDSTEHSLGIGPGGILLFALSDGSVSQRVFGTTPLQLNAWAHVAGIFDGNTMRVYLNDVLVGSNAASFSIFWNPVASTSIGSDPEGQQERYFEGSIDELRISDVDRYAASPISEFSCDTNTIALFHLNEAAGSDVADACHPVNVGKANGTTISAGKLQNARNFNGFGDNISLPNLPDPGVNAISIEAWALVRSYAIGGGETKWIYKRKGDRSDHAVGVAPDGYVEFSLCDGDSCHRLLSSRPISLNIWTHVVAVYDGREMRLYIDDELTGVYPTQFVISWASPVGTTLGGDPDGQPDRYFDGMLDEIRISDVPRILSGMETIRDAEPGVAVLFANYPNPVREYTVIPFSLSRREHVRLHIIDISGKLVAELVDNDTEAGDHRIPWNPSGLSSGPYFYQLQAGRSILTRRLVLR